MALDATPNSHALAEIIAQKIAAAPQQRIPFAEYMDLALYHPQYGYYSSGQAHIGSQGDFYTSPSLGADFGELLAEQFLQMWEILDYPRPFTLLEMGAGQGQLAADILDYLSRRYLEFFHSIEYTIVEQAPALITKQQQHLLSWQEQGVKLSWKTWQEIEEESLIGCAFSNELVDAFPVHQVTIEAGELREIYVTIAQAPALQFTEVTGKLSTPKLADYFQFVRVDFPSPAYPDGYRTEVNLTALEWLETVARRLRQGYLLTIDYGYPAHKYYHPQRRSGTLQCYYQHRCHNDPYRYLGAQDLTAHVDFTALERQGESCGLHPVGFTQQGLFLMALGLGDRLAALSQGGLSLKATIQRRDALHQLIDPRELGGFGVLVQSKGLSTQQQQQPLKGFSFPAP